MTLDPQAQAVLDLNAASNSALRYVLPLAEGRALSIATAAAANGPPEAVKHVEDKVLHTEVGDVPVRIYTPEGTGPFPALVYFHGGGWVFCNLDTHDGVSRQMANRVPAVVVSVDYRLAPENKFPAAVEDAYAATTWVAENASALNVDAQRVVVIGDSAGGNLAAVVALMARDRGGPKLAYQVLICPVMDYPIPGLPSYHELAEGYNLTRKNMIWFWERYLNSEQEASNPYAVPLRAESLKGLPPAFVITAEYDPLRDEGEAYVTRLQAEGVPARLKRYDSMIHGFVNMSGIIDQGKQAINEIAEVLRQM